MTNRPGRPRLDETSATEKCSVYLSTKDFDVLCREAHDAGLSLAALIRRKLQRAPADKNTVQTRQVT